MRSSALKTITVGTTVFLLAAGCGTDSSTGGEASSSATPSQTTSATPNVVLLDPPVLESGQTNQEVAVDVIDGLNTWFHAGRSEVLERWSPEDGDEALREVITEVVDQRQQAYADALLVTDFEDRWRESVHDLSIDDFVTLHQNTLFNSISENVRLGGLPADTVDVSWAVDGDVTYNAEFNLYLVPIRPIYEPQQQYHSDRTVDMTFRLEKEDDQMKISKITWP